MQMRKQGVNSFWQSHSASLASPITCVGESGGKNRIRNGDYDTCNNLQMRNEIPFVRTFRMVTYMYIKA